jgi:hypothetical protein
MHPELTALKAAFEQEAMSPEEIAEDRGLDVAAVKAGLMQCSSKYRKSCGHEEEEIDNLNFSNDELARVNSVIMDLALGAEDEHLRLKAAMYVRDDKKGRKDIVKGVAGQNFNILMINQKMAQVRAMSDKVKSAVLGNGQSSRTLIEA